MRTRGQGHSLTLVSHIATISHISSKAIGQIVNKFHVEALGGKETKICSNGPSHMNNMATMPIYGNNLLKSSSPEPMGQWP